MWALTDKVYLMMSYFAFFVHFLVVYVNFLVVTASLVFNISTVDGLERLVVKMTFCTLSGMFNYAHSLCG